MAMKKLTYAGVPLLAATMTASFTAQAVTVDQLNRQVQKLNQRIAAQDQRFRVNGFATFGIAKSDEEIAYNGVSDQTTWTEFTRAGIQMSFQVNQDSSVVTQIVGRGSEDFNANMEWAYFKHQFTNSLSAKVGRIRGPFYMLSEYLDVGYAVPWAQMPAETYSLLSPFANIDGVDLTWSTDIGWDTLEIKGFYGRTENENFIFDDVMGISATYSAETWSARLATTVAGLSFGSGEQGASTANAQALLEGTTAAQLGTQDAAFTSFGFRYDPGTLLVMGEYTTSSADGITQDEDSMYLTVGYRMGAWLPHLTYGMHESTDDKDRELPAGVPASTVVDTDGTTAGDVAALVQANSNSDTSRIGLGVRYDFGAGTALKLQYDIVDADSTGLFNATQYLQAGANAPDSANILTITIDTVF
ncbi:porin [Bermanella marisrubri]|uniref:Uncharacterized protein n=1 Tax=Bermanella marisrubri TaxID=207949 RepID=Q1N0F8_9GAMM|nr:porin [Bermanella marisrubri]EAT11706.1 hypothetical protein RED65_06147 [Oceanobacter sp. RED65] [Bermanella marisrubri]QIZ83259.1 porin [Bermanella marisrubri]